jgi:hypothetical protein
LHTPTPFSGVLSKLETKPGSRSLTKMGPKTKDLAPPHFSQRPEPSARHFFTDSKKGQTSDGVLSEKVENHFTHSFVWNRIA